LIPSIDNEFITLQDRKHRTVFGGSLGEIADYLLTFQHPEKFGSGGMFCSWVINRVFEQVAIWLRRNILISLSIFPYASLKINKIENPIKLAHE